MTRSTPSARYRGRSRLIFWLLFIALSYAALAPTPGCGKFAGIAAAYRTTIMVDRLARDADPHVARWVRGKAAACKAAHGAKTEGYRGCFAPAAAKGRAFVVAAKANRTTQDLIRATHLGIGKANVTRIAAAAGCALLRAAKIVGGFIPKLAGLLSKASALEGVTCGFAR